MKASSSLLGSALVSAALLSSLLSGCNGGAASAPPLPQATKASTSTSGSVPIASLNVMQPASTTAVNITSSVPAGPTTDIDDQATVAMSAATGDASTISGQGEHLYKGALRARVSPSGRRSTQDVAVNSPLDMVYHGGPVLGSAVSHDLFLNYDRSTRSALNFHPGKFLSDLGKDQFVTLIYQYLATPGVNATTPISGRYTKRTGADLTVTFKPPLTGDTNPYFGQLDILLQVLAASMQPDLGGGGDGHIYHVFLPKNVDTCIEKPLGTPTPVCYSPDNLNTFVFCAYHGVLTAGGKPYLYSVEPYQDVPGCRNDGVNNQPLPNAVSPTVDPADPGYSTLSHELFETITDPHISAWYNDLLGFEIGDLCVFDNFVTLNGHSYVIQSEYSDVNHICVSANLNATAQTPQGG